jgi:hypothetical protein
LVRKEVGGKFSSILLSINSGKNAAESKANSNGAKFCLLSVFQKAKKIDRGEVLFNDKAYMASSVVLKGWCWWGG